MSNMKIWDAVKQPPKEALKAIGAGRLKGKTDINPQWRMEKLTEVFGPCGIGWKYTIEKLWLEDGLDGQKFAFALVSLCIRDKNNTPAYSVTIKEDNFDKSVFIPIPWSDPIPGIGGSMLLNKESSGIHHNDEAFKMAVTDALSVAMKALGVASDIYRGLWDGSKYLTPPKQGKGAINPTTGLWEVLTEKQRHRLSDLALAVSDYLAMGDVEAALAELAGAELPNEEKAAIWTRFDSKQREMLAPRASR